jgi:hypothetical protein
MAISKLCLNSANDSQGSNAWNITAQERSKKLVLKKKRYMCGANAGCTSSLHNTGIYLTGI